MNDAEPAQANEILVPEKQVFAIVGPDMANVEHGLGYVDLRVATIQSDTTPAQPNS